MATSWSLITIVAGVAVLGLILAVALVAVLGNLKRS